MIHGGLLIYETSGKLIGFRTKDGLILYGFLMGERGKTCIIYIHGMTGSFYRGRIPFAIASRLARKNIGLFTINTRGHDQKVRINRPYSKKKSFDGGTNSERFKDCVKDIDGAISAMRKKGYKKFILAGQSTGCQKLAYYQYKKRNKDVSGLVLLGPTDDYAAQKMHAKRGFRHLVTKARRMVKSGKGSETLGENTFGFTAKRYLSVSDIKNVEARMFNYDGPLKEFKSIRAPILAVFGSRDQYAWKPVKEYLDILQSKTSSRVYTQKIVKRAKHSFYNHEAELADAVAGWLTKTI